MSDYLLSLDNEDISNAPPLYNYENTTLMLIETMNNLPVHSFSCLEEVSVNADDSLGLQIQLNQKFSFSQCKKRKTGCTCKKTNCMKMYCECFASGKICTPDCACYGCENIDGNDDVIRRVRTNTKIKGSSRKLSQVCTCKKSQCQKKYCQCFNAGMSCTSACRCRGCQNHSHCHENVKKQL